MFSKYYSLKSILKKEAQYNIIIGERSNGKTYACLKYGLEKYWKDGIEIGYIRRWKEDVRGKRASQLFASLVADGFIEKVTNGEYKTVNYYSGKFYLANYDENLKKFVNAPEPFCYGFALTEMEHDKSISFPKIGTIVFDEFLTRRMYLPDEFVLFMNTLSTIIRHRKTVQIFMLGNTVNKYCPYFKEMGLDKIPTMTQGKIDVYKYGESGLKVAVEYCSNSIVQSKPSDVYFAFDNPKLQMITGGKWEIDLYPHLPKKYTPSEIVFTYFIEFDDNILQCEVIDDGKDVFTFIHKKTTKIQSDDDVVYRLVQSPRPNQIMNITKPFNKMTSLVWRMFQLDKVFYQDNEIGEIVRNYLVQCGKLV